jgi:hypothetical protein
MSFKLPHSQMSLPLCSLNSPMVATGVARHGRGGKLDPGGVIQLRLSDELDEVVELLAVLALVLGVRPVALGLSVGIRAPRIIVSTESMNPITLALNAGLVVSEKGSTELAWPDAMLANRSVGGSFNEVNKHGADAENLQRILGWTARKGSDPPS